ncbi:DNA-binding protein [Xanthomonas hortorum]|uniref:DNA-binding protein n=1 Tax=Xanthomonas hortorum TaxID=56454 RepID=UPI001E510F55|nr:DNA-binding protein [Xanthomonas hortorum pv. gardneri]
MQQHLACEHYGNAIRQEKGVARKPAKQASSTTPPKTVADAAARGLRLREQHGRGGTAIGVARARDLSARKSLSTQTIRRMHAYFARHSVDKTGKGWADRSAPSAGYIAWLLWGGDAGQRWAARQYQRLEEAASAKTPAGKRASATTTAAAHAGAADKRTPKKTARKKAVAKKATGTSPARKPSATRAATKKTSAASAATRKAAPSAGARKATGKKAVKKAVKKTAARKSPAKKAASTKKAVNKTVARRTAAGKSASTRRAAKKGTSKTSAPWKRPNPKSRSRSAPLSPAQKTQARQRAKAAGRPYPNLVDNMAVAGKGSAAKRASGSGAAKKAGKP